MSDSSVDDFDPLDEHAVLGLKHLTGEIEGEGRQLVPCSHPE